jgi:hypothetical protein
MAMLDLYDFTNAEMIKLALQLRKTQNSIAQTFSMSQLAESHTEKLLPTAKIFDLVITGIFRHTGQKIIVRDK